MDLHTVDWHAREALRKLQPDALVRPECVDLHYVLYHSILLGVAVSKGEQALMGDDEGRYYHEDRLILLHREHWKALHEGGPGLHRARSTLAHELGHHALRDDPRVTDEERDAWAFAGCLLMPCDVVTGLADLRHTAVAETFDVSPQFALAHMDRMKRARML